MARPSSTLPAKFVTKKENILSQLALDPEDYTDKSPKGSVDLPILDLLRLINSIEGWVTTSSCSGRVAVYVEGSKQISSQRSEAEVEADSDDPPDAIDGDLKDTNGSEVRNDAQTYDRRRAEPRAGPGGKGGGYWLFVSHEPLLPDADLEDGTKRFDWLQKFNLHAGIGPAKWSAHHRTIHLSFSPLILHVLCATLDHARPLLTAAINAGFRESGVQSLKALDPNFNGDGVMVAIRTHGLTLDNIVGWHDAEKGLDIAMVDNEYLQMCVDLANERFQDNEMRKKRLVKELEAAIKRERWDAADHRETKDERRERKRRAGLEAQKMKQTSPCRDRSTKDEVAENLDTSSLNT